MKYYRVKYGYGKDDFYSIPETDVQRAMRSQVNGTIFICDEGSIAGNNIMSIQPDYNRLMGYNRDYQLTGEDYNEIGSKTVREHRIFLSNATKEALGSGTHTKLLDK